MLSPKLTSSNIFDTQVSLHLQVRKTFAFTQETLFFIRKDLKNCLSTTFLYE